MSHPHCISKPTNQCIVYPFHIPLIPWELSSLHTPSSPCTFPSTHTESNSPPLDIDTYHFYDFPNCVQYKILSMVAFLNILDKYDRAYHTLKSSF